MPLRLELGFGHCPPEPAERATISVPPASHWPFLHPLVVDLGEAPSVVVVADLHEAFINHQREGSHLVTTDASYLFAEWAQAVGNADVLMVAAADRASIERHAPEILARRGPFAHTTFVDAPVAAAFPPEELRHASPVAAELLQSLRVSDPAERLSLCVKALDRARTAPALVATASACMEVNDLAAAARDLDEALRVAPEWAAAHFERGKLWVRLDDMEAAGRSFGAAVDRLPGFASAWSNLGATLGELDRTEEALHAFQQALASDPSSPAVLNNIGVVSRELGRLSESEAAFRRVIDLVPTLAVGFYNLGHTLLLAGRYQAGLVAYREGQKRDPELNPVQASRLAICRLATGDSRGAIDELRGAVSRTPHELRPQLLADTQAVMLALLTDRPHLEGWSVVNDWLAAQL